MASGIPAHVNHELLVWARETAGIDHETVARRLNTKIERVLAWESGEVLPTMNQARALARLYRRPLSLFYFDSPPKDPPRPTDFRIAAPEEAETFPPAVRFAIRDAHACRDAAIRMLQLLGRKPVPFRLKADIEEDAESVGERLRKWSNLTYSEQEQCSSPYELYRLLRLKFERAGVLTFQMSGVMDKVASGFSIAASTLPAISVNNKSHEARRAFTLYHELTHLALRQGGICELSNLQQQTGRHKRIESFCNRAAGAALIPRAALLSNPLVRNHSDKGFWSEHEIHQLAALFCVSKSVTLIRLRRIRRATSQFVDERLDKYHQIESQDQSDAGFSYPHDKVASLNGHLFVRIVLDSFYSEQISLRDVADLLRLNLSHLDDLAEKVYREAS